MQAPEPGKTFWRRVDEADSKEFVLPADDPTLKHVRPGLAVFQSIIDGNNAGIGIKTLRDIPRGSFVATFTGVWAYNSDVDASAMRGSACVNHYAAGFGDLNTYVADNATVEANGLDQSTSHRIMCLVRHNRAETESTGCPRIHYDPTDQSAPSDVAGLFNHAKSGDEACNCEGMSCIVTAGEGLHLAVIVSTNRDVREGEELRWDYKWDPVEDDATHDDPVEVGLPFNFPRDTMLWTAPPIGPPVPDIDAYQGVGRSMTRDWSLQLFGDADKAALFRPEWCGPLVKLITVHTGLSAAVVVTQPSGADYRRQLPALVMR